MKLVIAEKPSVGAAIAAVMGANEKRSGYFEGGGYLVSWCIGHLISLADAATCLLYTSAVKRDAKVLRLRICPSFGNGSRK